MQRAIPSVLALTLIRPVILPPSGPATLSILMLMRQSSSNLDLVYKLHTRKPLCSSYSVIVVISLTLRALAK